MSEEVQGYDPTQKDPTLALEVHEIRIYPRALLVYIRSMEQNAEGDWKWQPEERIDLNPSIVASVGASEARLRARILDILCEVSARMRGQANVWGSDK